MIVVPLQYYNISVFSAENATEIHTRHVSSCKHTEDKGYWEESIYNIIICGIYITMVMKQKRGQYTNVN